MSRLGWFGVLMTLAYIGLFWWLFGAQISQISTLKPNELGDFLAGVFGPVALFWVVLGFFQQGLELRNSVETLKLQAEELKNSVEQQRELVKVSRDQIELDRETISDQREKYLREINPVFVVSKAGGHDVSWGRMFRFSILNKGEIASDVNIIIISDQFSPYEFRFPSIARGASENIEPVFQGSGLKANECRLYIRCSKRNGDPYEEIFSIFPLGSSLNSSAFGWGIKKLSPSES